MILALLKGYCSTLWSTVESQSSANQNKVLKLSCIWHMMGERERESERVCVREFVCVCVCGRVCVHTAISLLREMRKCDVEIYVHEQLQ